MTLTIAVDGVDITDDVIIAEARFTMANGPNPGDFEFKVKDATKSYAFRAGQSCDVDFGGVRVFEGYVLYTTQGHGFAVDDSVTAGPTPVERLWTLKGADLNILFRKRVVFDQADPSAPVALDLAPGTSDLTYLSEIISHLTLGDDNLTFDFHHVGSPNPDRQGIAISVGDAWERVMNLTAEIPGAIWGIRPPRTVYYEDDDTETAPFAISDTPNGTTSFGYSNFDWLHDGSRLVNDARIWGVGLGQDHLTYANVSDATSIATHGRWQNGNGWRYNLYKQSSVNLVANSLVYGSPENLHGPKDDSMVVSCRIKRPGIMPGHKVRIISNVFGEEIVLPVRRYTITFVNRDEGFFDLEMTWDIDTARTIFEYPPFPDIPRVIPPITVPNPCDDLQYAFGLIDSSFGWEVVHNHPWLGNSYFGAGTIHLQGKKRYNQTFGSIFVADYGDGVAGSLNYLQARHRIQPKPSKWAIQIEFRIPSYSMVETPHQAPFPDFSFNILWGGDNLDIIPSISLDLVVFGTPWRLFECINGFNRVFAAGYSTTSVAQGTAWHFEAYSNGQSRAWPHGGVRPLAVQFGGGTTDAGAASGEPYDAATFGPDRPWTFPDTGDYVYLKAQMAGSSGGKSANPGVVTGNPNATNTTIRNNFDYFTGSGLFGPTMSGANSGYHEDLKDGYTADIGIMNFNFITLPDDFNFASQVPVDCSAITPAPVAGAEFCQVIAQNTASIGTGHATYSTLYPFALGSTKITLEGVEQRLGIDYHEDLDTQAVVFNRDVPGTIKIMVCYQVVSR